MFCAVLFSCLMFWFKPCVFLNCFVWLRLRLWVSDVLFVPCVFSVLLLLVFSIVLTVVLFVVLDGVCLNACSE